MVILGLNGCIVSCGMDIVGDIIFFVEFKWIVYWEVWNVNCFCFYMFV